MISLEESIRRQSDILELADAWMAKHQGIVVPGVTISRDEWIQQMHALPLWRRIQSRISDYAAVMKKGRLRHDHVDIAENAKVIDCALSVHYVFEHFLAHPDYSKGDKHNKFGDPKVPESVLRDYVPIGNGGEGQFLINKGVCKRVYHYIHEDRLSSTFLLENLGLIDRWRAYAVASGIPKDFVLAVKSTLRHFFQNPDYNNSHWNDFGTPKNLEQILRDHRVSDNEGDGGCKNSRGDCAHVYQALMLRKFTQHQLLQSAAMENEYAEYRVTTGIPREHMLAAKNSITHFLRNPSYCGNYNRYQHVDAPKNLSIILRDYQILNEGPGIFKNGRGDARRVHTAIFRRKKYDIYQLLELTGLLTAWDNYQHSSTDHPYIYNTESIADTL